LHCIDELFACSTAAEISMMKDFKYFSEQQTLEAAIRGRGKQTQNKHVHGVVISLILLATAFFWYMRPTPVNLQENHDFDHNNYAKPFSWNEVCLFFCFFYFFVIKTKIKSN
jgi:hypothetical protein